MNALLWLPLLFVSLSAPPQEKSESRQAREDYAAWMAGLGVDLLKGEDEMAAFAQAERDFREQRYDQATPTLEKVLTDHPASSLADDALWMLAQIDLAEKRDEEGVKRIRRLLETYRDPAWLQEANRRLVLALLDLKREDEAKETARKFATQYPGSLITPWLRTIAGLEGVTPTDPDAANRHWTEIESYRDQTRWLGEEVLLKDHLRDFPASRHKDSVRREQMRLTRNHLPYEGAERRCLTELLAERSAFPDTALAWVRLAQGYYYEGDRRKAADAYERLLTDWPHSNYTPLALVYAALARMTLGDADAAARDLAAAERLTFDPYRLRDVALAREYTRPNVDWRAQLEQMWRIIEDPATSVGKRAAAHARVALLNRLVPPNRDPSQAAVWKVRLFIFTSLDHEWETKDGEKRHTVFELTPTMIEDILATFERYKADVFKYSRGAVRIESEEHVVRENARVNKVDWNSDNPDLFWNQHGHPLEQIPDRDTGPFQSDFWVLPCQGLPVWAPAGAGGVEENNGRAHISFHYGPTWKDWFRPVYLHEWLHTVDSGFWLRGWKPQFNLVHTHAARDWSKPWPADSDPDWAIGYMKGYDDPFEDWFSFYEFQVSVLITPRMWRQARLDGVTGDQGARLYELSLMPADPSR